MELLLGLLAVLWYFGLRPIVLPLIGLAIVAAVFARGMGKGRR